MATTENLCRFSGVQCLTLVLLAVSWFDHASASTAGQREFLSKVMEASETFERTPELKKGWNARVRSSREIVLVPPVFTCDTSFGRSTTRPTSVHELRPGDIDVLAAFGDSISAGNGLGAETLPAVAIENRGEVFTIGGDRSLEDGVVTLTNIIRKFNPNVMGYSQCPSTQNNIQKTWYNVAEPGGDNTDMPPQATLLVQRMRDDYRVNMTQDWKMVSLFIGGNDLCAVCRKDKHSVENYYARIDQAVDIMFNNLTRTIVNLISMFDITPLEDLSDGSVACEYLQWHFCDCARNETTKATMRPIQLEYHEQLKKIADDPKYKVRDDFTVVLQPHMRDMVPPIDNSTGDYLEGFLSPDCFHPNRIAHQAFAGWLWNTLLKPVGGKPYTYDSNNLTPVIIDCPTQASPLICTDKNNCKLPANQQTKLTRSIV